MGPAGWFFHPSVGAQKKVPLLLSGLRGMDWAINISPLRGRGAEQTCRYDRSFSSVCATKRRENNA